MVHNQVHCDDACLARVLVAVLRMSSLGCCDDREIAMAKTCRPTPTRLTEGEGEGDEEDHSRSDHSD